MILQVLGSNPPGVKIFSMRKRHTGVILLRFCTHWCRRVPHWPKRCGGDYCCKITETLRECTPAILNEPATSLQWYGATLQSRTAIFLKSCRIIATILPFRCRIIAGTLHDYMFAMLPQHCKNAHPQYCEDGHRAQPATSQQSYGATLQSYTGILQRRCCNVMVLCGNIQDSNWTE